MNIHWHIGDVIAKLRRAKRMNQTALAGRVGVNKATIVRAEDGDPKVSRETYLKIAQELGTTLARLEVEAARLQATDGVSHTQETQRAAVAAAAGGGFRRSDGSTEPSRARDVGPPSGVPERRKTSP